MQIHVVLDKQKAVLTVADEGSGVPAEHRKRIFDRFFRIDSARSRDRGGMGLGLAITRWAVEVNGGRISVDDGATHGSVFRIVLPMGAPPIAVDLGHTTQPMGEHV